MGSYTKIGLKEGSSIFQQYGLEDIRSLTPLSLGISNSNYKVECQKKNYLLKISNDKNRLQLEQEQLILGLLRSLGYPYSLCPYPLLSGGVIFTHGAIYGVVYPFVEGIPPGPSDFTCQEIGKGLAELHSLRPSSKELASIRSHDDVGFGHDVIREYTLSKKCPADFKQSFDELFPNFLDSFYRAEFEEGIIHGDLYYDNTLFNQNVLSSVLDFEQAGRGSFILDLGISISGTCLEKGRIIKPLIKSYLKGYESVRPLPSVEKANLDQSIVLGLLSISLWRIKRFTEGTLDPSMKDSYKELLWRAKSYTSIE